MQLRPGTTLQDGKFKIIKVLGQGGFGITYLAENLMLHKYYAIKEFFPKDFCNRTPSNSITLGTESNRDFTNKLKARFLKEAENIARLDHPYIVQIHDIFEENDTAYFVMDYIEGRSLADIVALNGPLPDVKALEIIAKIGDAVDNIHSEQMTHFDIKPSNIMVRLKDDQPVLIDFGLSKRYNQEGTATSTVLQAVSHGYSALELYKTGIVQSFSPETDVYSLGATFYFLITGQTPPDASSMVTEDYDAFNCIPLKYRKVIKKSMSARRNDRYHSAREFYEALVGGDKPRKFRAKNNNKTTQDKEKTVIYPPQQNKKSEEGKTASSNNNTKGRGKRKKGKKRYGLLLSLGIIGILGLIVLIVALTNLSTKQRSVQYHHEVNSEVLDSIISTEREDTTSDSTENVKYESDSTSISPTVTTTPSETQTSSKPSYKPTKSTTPSLAPKGSTTQKNPNIDESKEALTPIKKATPTLPGQQTTNNKDASKGFKDPTPKTPTNDPKLLEQMRGEKKNNFELGN